MEDYRHFTWLLTSFPSQTGKIKAKEIDITKPRRLVIKPS